ncbi:hypothetical protein D3C86_2250230 [compost metagenome]
MNASLDGAFEEAEALLLDRFGKVTLAELSRDFHARILRRGQAFDLDAAHPA